LETVCHTKEIRMLQTNF